MAAAVTIDSLQKTYRSGKTGAEKQALKGVSLEIPEGSFFGLLGPNGAGKSTMINIMAGLVNKTSGKVVVGGHDIDTDARQARLALGVVPQELVIDTFFTVRQALDIHAGYYGVPKEARRTEAIIEALGLSEQADVNSRRLSGGMRRRLLIGKALVHNPPVLILDEPTAGVDVELREQLWDYVRMLNRQGTTVLLTTHYLEEAQELCDQIAIINHGELVALDSKANLMKRMDSKGILFHFAEPLGTVPKSMQGFNAEVTEEGALKIGYQPSSATVSELLQLVQNNGRTVTDIVTEEPALEDIFRQLTRPLSG